MKNQEQIIREAFECWLLELFDTFFIETADEANWKQAWSRLNGGLSHAKKCRDALCGLGDQLFLVFKENSMAAQKQKLKMAPTAKGSKGAVMPSVTWSTVSAGIGFVVVDANGTPVGAIDPTTVATTLVSDNPAVTIAPGADSLSYTVTRTSATGNANLTATLTYNSGSPGPFGATLPIVLDALAPGAPTDLQLTISGN